LQGLTITILAELGAISKDKGTPNSTEMTEGFNGLYMVTVILLFMAPAGFVILFFHLAGKFLSMLVRLRWKDVRPLVRSRGRDDTSSVFSTGELSPAFGVSSSWPL
jgi:hypothetical protein